MGSQAVASAALGSFHDGQWIQDLYVRPCFFFGFHSGLTCKAWCIPVQELPGRMAADFGQVSDSWSQDQAESRWLMEPRTQGEFSRSGLPGMGRFLSIRVFDCSLAVGEQRICPAVDALHQVSR